MFHRRIVSTTGKRWLLIFAAVASLVFASVTYMQHDTRRRGEAFIAELKNDALMRNEVEEVQRDHVAEHHVPVTSTPPKECSAPKVNPNKPTFDVSEMLYSLKMTDLTWDGDVGVWDPVVQKKFEIEQQQSPSLARKLKVFVVPFSHSDPGWLMTVDQYLLTYTKNTLDLMLERLQKWPEMTFIWAEVSFLELWWNTLDEVRKQQARALVASGRLEIVNGGYVMPDEASTHYYAILHQYVYGHQWLQQHLNVTPRHGFSIDPFGYSSTMPYLLKNVGFQSIYIQRVHYIIRKRLLHAKTSQFSWQQTWDTKNSEAMFTYLSHSTLYDIKHTCGQDTSVCLQFDYQFNGITDNQTLVGPAKQLLEQFRKTSHFYPHNAILFPIGMDFRWSSPNEWDAKHQNFRFMMDYLNSNPANAVEIQFGTYNDYYQEVFKQMGTPDKWKGLPSVTGDFFPYADRTIEYWTGYFTSHPFQKALSRDLENHLRAAEILFVLAKMKGLPMDSDALLATMESAAKSLGLYQHHDALTGTSKQAVSDDYELRLFNGVNAMYDVMQYAATSHLWPRDTSHEPLILQNTRSDPKGLASKKVLLVKGLATGKRLVVFNTLAAPRHVVVDVLVDAEHVVIHDSDGNTVPYQVSLHLDPRTFQGETLSTGFRLTFFVECPSLGMRSFSIRGVAVTEAAVKGQKLTQYSDKRTEGFSYEKSFRMENKYMKADFSPSTGLLESITDNTGKKHTVRLEFKRYETVKSGAYLFWPFGIGDLVPYPHQVRLLDGALYSEIQVVLPGVLRHTVRLFKTSTDLGQSLHVENTHNLLNSGQPNIEAVMRFSTEIKNNFVFHTDSNAFQMVRRRASHDLPMQANYFPATNMVFLQDKNTRLTLHLGEPHGVGSQDIGQIEFMMDRFLSQDDARGVEEALRDPRTVRTSLRIQLELGGFCPDCIQHQATSTANRINLDLNYPSHVMSASLPAGESVKDQPLSAMTTPLPCNIHLVMLKPVTYRANSTQVGLVLHQIGTDCTAGAKVSPGAGGETDCTISSTVDLPKFLNFHSFSSYNETTLNFIDILRTSKSDLPVRVDPMKLVAVTLSV